MRTARLSTILLLLLLLVTVRAQAIICTTDAVPAATLLLPYFEVDLNNPNGVQTLLSINNASATAVLVHLVLWSDLSVPVFDFNIYLTGYDVQTINLRDIIDNGRVPQTASAGQDPTDTISPQGKFSQDINFASCSGVLPPPPLPALFVTHLQNALTGKPSAVLGGNCAGQILGDNIARGYLTADTVSNCTLHFPGDTGYFVTGGAGDATNQNVIWGDWYMDGNGVTVGGTLVHIEASGTNPATSTPGRYTFYGRYDGWTASDNREPLSTNFATRFLSGGPFLANTSLLVWRDSKVSQGPFTCPTTPGQRPPWYPLAEEGIVIFDEQEHPQVPATFPFSPPPPVNALVPFPAEAQRTRVNGPALPVPYLYGWLYLDLNTTVASAGSNPPIDSRAAQAYVISVVSSRVQSGAAIDAILLDSACAANHNVPGGP
jgi:hypothetical protein